MIVVGTGGVELDPTQQVGSLKTTVQGAAAEVLATAAFLIEDEQKLVVPAYGYLSIEYSADGTWTGNLLNPSLTWGHCGSTLAQQGSVCALADGVTPLGVASSEK